MNKSTKTFKVFDPENNQEYGRFCGKTPKQAASKALTSLFKSEKIKKDENGKISFDLEELISNNENNQETYNCVGKRTKLDEPICVHNQNGSITYKYLNVACKNDSSNEIMLNNENNDNSDVNSQDIINKENNEQLNVLNNEQLNVSNNEQLNVLNNEQLNKTINNSNINNNTNNNPNMDIHQL